MNRIIDRIAIATGAFSTAVFLFVGWLVVAGESPATVNEFALIATGAAALMIACTRGAGGFFRSFSWGLALCSLLPPAWAPVAVLGGVGSLLLEAAYSRSQKTSTPV